MLIKTYNQRDKVIAQLEKRFSNIPEFYIEESRGMGSYETFYINFATSDDIDTAEYFEIRFSGHSHRSENHSTPNYYLWNDDYKTVTELYKAIEKIIKGANDGRHC